MTTITLPEQMALDGSLLPISTYLSKKSQDFSQRHLERKEGVSVDQVAEMLRICIEGRDLPEETEKWFDQLNEEVCRDLWNTENFNNQNNDMHKQTEEVALEPQPLNLQLVEIVEAARTTTMANGFSELLAKYDFGPEFSRIEPKDGAAPTARDLAACCGAGVDMGNSGKNLVAAAVAQLLAQGDSMVEVVQQIGSVLKLKYSTLSNYYRTYERTPARYKSLPFDVQKEIATSTYTGDEKEDRKIREQLFEQAEKEGWNGSEARSARKRAQGHDEEITAGAPGGALTPWKPRYLYQLPGQKAKMSKDYPPHEEGMVCFDLKDFSFMWDDGKSVSFQPMERAE